MASTYSPLLRFELIGSGEQAGLWGNTTNSNLGSLVEQAIAGTTFVALSNASDYVLSSLNGAVDEARAGVLVISGNPGANTNLVVPALQKRYTVRNTTSYTLTIKTSAQVGGVAIAAGNTLPVFCDGTNVYAAVTPGAIGAPTSDGTGATGTWDINISGNAGTVTNGVYTNDLTSGASQAGSANKIPRYTPEGNLALGTQSLGTWDDTNLVYRYGVEFGPLGALFSSTLVTGGAAFANQARAGIMCNGYWQGNTLRNKSGQGDLGGGVSALEMYPKKAMFRFSTTSPTSAGTAVVLDNAVVINSGGVTANAFAQFSDRRLKKDIKKLTGAMEKVAKINGYTYDRIDIEGDSRQVGLMADEVKAVVPEAVTTGEDGFDRVAYGNLVALLVECVKSQEKSITKLQERCRALEAKVM